MKFEEQFPSLKKGIVLQNYIPIINKGEPERWEANGLMTYILPTNWENLICFIPAKDIQKHCLDKQKAIEIIEKNVAPHFVPRLKELLGLE